MKHYKAVIENVTLGETPVIMEQDRVYLGKDFMKNVILCMFTESCMGGINAKHMEATITVGDKFVCRLSLYSHYGDGYERPFSGVYADLYITAREYEEALYLRTMTIGE